MDDAPFREWCGANKVLWPKLAVGSAPGTGRGVLATEAIHEGEVVVEVPDDAVLMAENCSIAELLAEAGLAKPAADALLEVQGLVVAVMAERALGIASRWAPYLGFLPDSMDHMPVYWQPDELAELRGTAALDKLEGRVQHPADAPTRVEELFGALVVPLVEGDKGLAKALLGPKGLPSKGKAAEEAKQRLLQQYKWATSAVASYSFILGDEQFQSMCPVWDLLNHVTGRANVRLRHDAARGALQMVATRPIAAGEEVVNNYGRLCPLSS
ncbi:hypothetical protein MNEG_9948 [Monoraphidium neglectum]|uniref:SET domain-containing protein n=1 Tax=Monoraphidium neglectum TaxID=145388 RepID=A0A0D2JEP5_9CHLO|nr:hypothetical protein MNEG_9948 [Monoraphidium neglectum]KIY98017.1 hypothetical protein MNEG_9948 [Monoraphidium neglectum]|eukprot:XP_013897037.1 hypothetical protein MNEG_9948 [Monoraphidium neglectum]